MTDPDWAALPSDLVACIGSLLIADDLAHFIRFHAVCHPWRSSTEETKRRAECLQPRNWIMLSVPNLSPVQFYNTSTHKSFKFDAVFHPDYCLFGSFGCLILLVNNSTQGFALLNPFMRSITQLPSKIESDCPEAPSNIQELFSDPKKNLLSDVYVTSASIIVLRFFTLDFLVWTKPGEESWAYAEFEISFVSNVLFYEDRIFTIDFDGHIVQINFANEIISQPRVEVVIPHNELPVATFDNGQYLTNCGGNIILFNFPDEYNYRGGSFEMYKLDVKEKKHIRITDLGNHSVFLGAYETLSVSCENSHLISANCIYFCNFLSDNEIDCYNLSTSRLIPWSKMKSSFRPPSLVEKLVNYCL